MTRLMPLTQRTWSLAVKDRTDENDNRLGFCQQATPQDSYPALIYKLLVEDKNHGFKLYPLMKSAWGYGT